MENDKGSDDSIDSDYENEIGEEYDDLYEYESDDDLVGDGSDFDDEYSETTATSEVVSTGFKMYPSPLQLACSEPQDVPPEIEMLKQRPYEVEVDYVDYPFHASRDGREHIAGPGCVNRNGYSGHRIAVEEIKGCYTVQCIVRKGRCWTPEPEDQEFERSSDYCISGLSCNGPLPTQASEFLPVRHEIAPRIYPDAYRYEANTTCFEIFSHVSRLYTGRIDVQGLMECRTVDSRHGTFEQSWTPERNPEVHRGAEQCWNHEPGSEYLVANPVIIPKLSSLLRSAIQGHGASFDINESPFPALHKEGCRTSRDQFSKLPAELIAEMLSYLCSRDIAHLRLASHVFRHLPISVWHRLLKQEVPWLWEAWDSAEPSVWLATSPRLLKDREIRRQTHQAYIQFVRDIIVEEMPGTWEKIVEENHPLTENYHELRNKLDDAVLYAPGSNLPHLLPARSTDWYQVYRGVRSIWNELGLRNRRRIWKDMEETIDRIQKFRSEGKIA